MRTLDHANQELSWKLGIGSITDEWTLIKIRGINSTRSVYLQGEIGATVGLYFESRVKANPYVLE